MKYYSEVLDKVFETEKELKAAEKEKAEEEKRKADAKALVKKESDIVNAAFVARNTARKAYNDKVSESYKIYLEKVKAAREEYENSIKEVVEAKNKAEAEFDTKYREFDKNHPEGYRLCLKDGDDVLTVNQEKRYNADFFDTFNKLAEMMFKNW